MVQMNKAEFATIVGRELEAVSEIARDCNVLHGAGPETALITLGEDGVLLSTQCGAQIFHIPALNLPRVVDTTGCGDTLAAAAIYRYILTGDLLQSAVVASRYAAAKATFSGLDGFRRMDEILNDIGHAAEPVRL
jgi:sugar/nucleoside kinase (ribokinase family)